MIRLVAFFANLCSPAGGTEDSPLAVGTEDSALAVGTEDSTLAAEGNPLAVGTKDNQHVINNNPFISGHNVLVTGGTFNQDNAASNGRKSPFDILREATAPHALHDSNAEFDRPKCHPNTREAVLKKIMNWARRRDRETWDNYIMWLTGAAGAGKSAITKSFIEMCLLNELVLATFIFWRSDGTRNHADAFVATIAYQIYQKIPATQSEILSAIEADPLIVTKGLEDQFTHLVMKPLQNVCGSGISSPLASWRVIVIDGLDECGDGVLQARILRMIADAILTFKLPILFLIASRPEHEINLAFRSNQIDGLFSRLYLDGTFHPDDDIRRFLRDGFEEIKVTHPFKSLIPASWPSNEILEEIVRKSSGQFIYAATVFRYCQSTRYRPDHRLDVVNNLRPAKGDLPFAQLDALYTMILNSAADTESVLYMLSIYSHHVVYTGDDTSEFDISTFMSLEPGELELLVCDLGAIVSIEKVFSKLFDRDVEVVKILHTSLHDFLFDPMRFRDHFLDIDIYRSDHIANIIQYVIKDPWRDHFFIFYDFMEREFPLCQSSPSLINIAEKFLILDLLLEEIDLHKEIGVDHYTPSMDLRQFVLWLWLPFCARMAPLDVRWDVIEKRHQEYMERLFSSQLLDYYEHDEVILLLCVACHLGNDMFVPIVPRAFDQMQYPIFRHETQGYDMLYLLRSLELEDGQAQYLQHFRHFLQDPDNSGSYAIGPSAYAKAALNCVKKLEVAPLSRNWYNGDEDELLNTFSIDSGRWTFNAHISQHKKFMLLGYIIFFLPRAAFYEPLFQHCQQQTFLNMELTTTFPIRTALVQQKMKDYLERVRASAPGSL